MSSPARSAATSLERRHPRYDRRLRVMLATGDQTVATISRNIGLGGIYLVTDRKLPFGTEVTVSFYLMALKDRAEIKATVRWQGEDGLGLQFHSIGARTVWALNRLFHDA